MMARRYAELELKKFGIAEYTMPFEATFTGNDADLVPFIFEHVNQHDVKLLDYTFENDNKSLILNLGDDVYTIQGSAGALMFVETLAKSYFENFASAMRKTTISMWCNTQSQTICRQKPY